MSIKVEIKGGRKVTSDDMNPRIYHVEWKCEGCGEWVDEDEVIWALNNGQLNTDTGDPYCDACVPEETMENKNEQQKLEQ